MLVQLRPHRRREERVDAWHEQRAVDGGGGAQDVPLARRDADRNAVEVELSNL